MKQKLGILIFILIAAFLLQPFFVSIVSSEGSGAVSGNKEEIDTLNETIVQKKEKIKELEKSIEDYKLKIEQSRTEAVSLSNQLGILDNHLTQIELDIKLNETKIDTLQLEIESLELSITDKEQVIERQKTILKELIRTLHYENGKKYIEVMVAYNNFSDFYNRVQYLKTIETDLGQNAKVMRLAKEDLENKQAEAEKMKKSYEDLKEQLVNRKKDLEEQSLLKQTLLAQTQSSELTYKTMVKNLKKQYSQIESEISNIEQEVRKKLESQNKLDSIGDDDTVLSWPTQSRYITAYFHDPSYPYRYIVEHNAVDIRAAQGTPVHATASGYVARAHTCSTSDCYAYVLMVHSGGMGTLYGHLSKILVDDDQFVTRGDIIGYSGAMPGTIGAGPFTTGPHLHFEVRKDGIPVNPLNYLIRDWE